MIASPLPTALGAVSVPRFLSPSRFTDFLKCRLWVLTPAAVSGALPIAPIALLGTVLHHVASEVGEGLWGGEATADAAFDSILQATIAAVELPADGDPIDYPLRDSIGAQKWFSRIHSARSWAREDAPSTSRGMPRMISPRDSKTAIGRGPTEALVETGHEAWIVWPGGRLRGRADLVESLSDGRVRVVKNKSGALRDRNGDLLEGIALQVGLYALAIESVLNVPVEPVVRANERIDVPWNPSTREGVRALLDAALVDLPADIQVPAGSLAVPGPHCKACRLRAICPNYLGGAARLWTSSEMGGRMPLDVWGRVERVDASEDGVRAELRDDAGRFVVVAGLSPSWGIQNLQRDARIYFFDLEAGEDRQHAERVQPANLRELPPAMGSYRKRAFRLRIYTG